jgi:hypothetical protein
MIPRITPTEDGRMKAAQQGDGTVGEQLLGVVGVVAVDGGAETHLADGVAHRLAHLAVDDLGERLGPFDMQRGHPAHDGGALAHRPRRPTGIRGSRACHGVGELRVGGSWVAGA